MNEIDELLRLDRRFQITGEPHIEIDMNRIKQYCERSLKLQELVKELATSDKMFQSLLEESKK